MTEFIVILIFIIAVAALMLLLKGRPSGGRLLMTIRTDNLNIKGEIKLLSLRSTQFATSGELQAVDRLGNPAEVEPGSVRFVSSNEGVFRAEQDPDNEKVVKVVATGNGVAELHFVADADLGEGVVTIQGFMGVEVLPAQAVGFAGLSFGEPQEQ